MSDTVEMVRNVPMFAELEDDELRWIAELATEFEVPAGFVLLERGQRASGMFIITEGTVTVELPHGPVEIGPGEFIGELPLLARRRPSRVSRSAVWRSRSSSSVSRAWP